VSERVSWLEVKPGWRVLGADGSRVGEVDEVVGDEGRDIFDGLSIATSALGQPAYATAEQVANIEDGVVHLTLSGEQAHQLARYLQPATSLEIEPDDHRGAGEAIGAEARKIEGRVLEPTGRHEHPLNFFTRVAHLIRRTRGR
jgi:hypothetical protein